MTQPFESEERSVNIAGLIIEFGSTSLVDGVVKTGVITVVKQGDSWDDYISLFTIEAADSNAANFGTVQNKYNNVSEVVRHLHRQTYFNAFEAEVTNHAGDNDNVSREEVMKLLLTAAGLLGVNVWSSLSNPQEAVKGAFKVEEGDDIQTVSFTRRVVDGNFVTEFEEEVDRLVLFGVHQLVHNGEPIDTASMGIPANNTFINSVVTNTKTVITVAGSMYNPQVEAGFRAAAIDGGVMMTPKDQYIAYSEGGVIRNGADSISYDLDNWLITVPHEATPAMMAAIADFNDMKPGVVETDETGAERNSSSLNCSDEEDIFDDSEQPTSNESR